MTRLACTEREDYVLTHELVPAGPVPTAFDPDGVYPYVSYSETSHRPVPKRYRFAVLENDKISVAICPDLGGRVASIIHKGSGKEVLYVPDVIRPTRILPRFGFVAAGIEVSFPISHSPTQNETVLHKIDRTKQRVYVTCGERELRFGMQWSVEYSLGADDDFLTQRAVFHNPGSSSHPWMSWSNAAVPSTPDTEFHFPRGKVLSHSSKLETIEWHESGPRRESDIKEMTGFFWKTKDANAFGAFTPSLGTGLYHVADEARSPGMKLWSYGVGKDRAWARLSAAKSDAYAEIQGGPIKDQSVKLQLRPKETRWHVELWIPSDKPMDIYALKVPAVALRPVNEVPLFDWARQHEVQVWKDLGRAHTKGRQPEPPEVHQCLWAPSGMEHMDPPSNRRSRPPRARKRTDGDFTTVLGWPEQEKGRRPSRFSPRAAWGSHGHCWPGCSNWRGISRVPPRRSDQFRSHGSNCIPKSSLGATVCFANWEHIPWPNGRNG